MSAEEGLRPESTTESCFVSLFQNESFSCLSFHNLIGFSLAQLTRGQRPNESQKAVIIDMMKSVGEIASQMWPVV